MRISRACRNFSPSGLTNFFVKIPKNLFNIVHYASQIFQNFALNLAKRANYLNK
jgi:hypothetical protein